MNRYFKSGKVNVRFLVILAVVVIVIGGLGYGGLKLRRHYVVSRAFKTGLVAYAAGEWQTARKDLGIYLAKRPESPEILEKYAVAQLSVEPVEPSSIGQAINAYRRLMRLEPGKVKVYQELARLYEGVGDYVELAYIANKRLEQSPEDSEAKLWLAKAMLGQNKGEEARPVLVSIVEGLEKQAEKRGEYGEACGLLARLVMMKKERDAWSQAIQWLDRGVNYDPACGLSLVERAKFYRLGDGSGLDLAERKKRAEADLRCADKLTISDPRVRLSLSLEWMEWGDYSQAKAELEAVREVDKATVRKYFLNPADWAVARFVQSSELAIRMETLEAGMAEADAVLPTFSGRYQRLRVLPSAILLYSYGGRLAEARKSLEEYLDILHRLETNPEPAVKVAYLQALVADVEGHPYRAIEHLEPMVTTNSSNTMLLRLLARAYSRTDQPRRAVRTINEYLRYHPGDQQMTMQLMGEYLKLKQFDKALAVAKQTEGADSIDMVIRLLGLELGYYAESGSAFSARKQGLEVISGELKRLRAKHPEKVEVRLLEANLAMQQGDLSGAEAILKGAIKECPDHFSAEHQLARLYVTNKRMDEAISVLKGACKDEGDLAGPWEMLAELQTLNGQLAEARKTLRSGIEAVSSEGDTHKLRMKLAVLEVTQGEREEGVSLLKSLAKEDGKNVKVRALLLDLPEIRKDQAAAQTLVDELKEIQGQSGLLWRLAQASLWMANDNWREKQQEIAGHLQRCIDGDPGWSAPVLLMGQMYEQLGKTKEAETLYRKGIYENPSALAVADRLIDLLEKQKRYSEVMKVLEQVDARGKALDERKTMAAIKAGELTQAIEQLKLKIANDPKDVGSRILLARLYYRETKDVAGALATLAEAEELAKESLTVQATRVAILRAENRVDEARRILDGEVAKRGSFQAYLLRAGFFLSVGQPDLAEKDYRAMTALGKQGEGYEVLSAFYFNSKKYAEAVRTLEAGIKAFPENLSLQRGLMKSLFLRDLAGDRDRAMALLKDLETKLPDDPDLMWVQAVVLLNEGSDASLRKGRELLTNVVTRNPNMVDAHLGLINLAVRESDVDQARDLAIRALGANPTDSRLLLARAGIERRLNNLGLAIEMARGVLEGDPNNRDALNLFVNAAVADQKLASLTEAETRVGGALRDDPSDVQLHLLQATVLNALGRRGEAIAKLKAFGETEDGRKSLSVSLALTELCRLNQDLAGAEQWLRQAASLKPGSPSVLREQIFDLAGKQKYAEVKTLIDAYRKSESRDAGVIMVAASVFASSGQRVYLDEAAELFEVVLKAVPGMASAKKGLAQVTYMLGQVDRAESLYREVLEVDPNNTQALNDLAWLLTESKRRYEEALPLAEKGVQLDSEDVHLRDTRATIYENLAGRLQEARADFEKCVELAQPGSAQQARAYYKLGKVWGKLGSKVKAKECFDAALKIDGKVKAFGEKERVEMAEGVK